MINEIPTPGQRLSKDCIKVWLISETTLNIIGLIMLGGLFYLNYHFSWREWAGWVIVVLAIFIIIDIISYPIRLQLRYKHWRFGMNKAFLQLKMGAVNEKHQLIPMAKIQSVSIHQGPVLRKYNLCTIKVNTITTNHTIPALPETEAMELRSQIAYYANVQEMDE